MNHLSFTRIAYLFGVVMVLSLIASVPCLAQNRTTLSGTVVDTEGKPIAGFAIGLLQGSLISVTDEKGAFTFTNIPAGPVQIALPTQPSKENEKPILNFEADDALVSIKIKGITLYQDMRPPFGGITFGVKSGNHIEDITVTVRPRVRIRAKVVFKNGKPLTNTSVATRVEGDGGRSSGGATTDSEGYFVHYMDNDDVPAHYTVTVKYKGLSAKSEQFLLEKGARYDDLVLTLDGDVPPAALQTESLPKVLDKLTGGSTPSEKPILTETNRSVPTDKGQVNIQEVEVNPRVTNTEPTNPVRQMRPPWEKDAWAVNPANGHGYKKIRCDSLDEARDRAAAQGAHLVAINDAAEQQWLLGLFGNHLYWIGLSDAENEGEWVWQNGEPLTYTNWGPKHRFPRSPLSPEKKDTAIMTFANGQWHAVGPGDLLWHKTKMAILEKSNVLDGE